MSGRRGRELAQEVEPAHARAGRCRAAATSGPHSRAPRERLLGGRGLRHDLEIRPRHAPGGSAERTKAWSSTSITRSGHRVTHGLRLTGMSRTTARAARRLGSAIVQLGADHLRALGHRPKPEADAGRPHAGSKPLPLSLTEPGRRCPCRSRCSRTSVASACLPDVVERLLDDPQHLRLVRAARCLGRSASTSNCPRSRTGRRSPRIRRGARSEGRPPAAGSARRALTAWRASARAASIARQHLVGRRPRLVLELRRLGDARLLELRVPQVLGQAVVDLAGEPARSSSVARTTSDSRIRSSSRVRRRSARRSPGPRPRCRRSRTT